MSDRGTGPDLHALVAESNLAEVSCFELSARLGDATSDDLEGVADLGISQELIFGTRDDDAAFRIRIRTLMDVPEGGQVVVGIAGEWDYAPGTASQIAESVMLDFVNNVAIMVLMPFIREHAADLSRRVFGNALMLPMMQRGQIQFDAPASSGLA